MSLQAGGAVDVIHGVEVRDPYRWLEDRQLPATGEWIERQSELCSEYFTQRKSFAPLRQMVSDALFGDEIDQAVRVHDKVFLRKQLKGQEQAAIWIRHDGETEDRLLVDPAMLGSNFSVELLRISLDGTLLAYSVKSSGSDAMEVRFADVLIGSTLPDCLPFSYLQGLEFDDRRRGFYYSIVVPGGTAAPSINFHLFGDSQQNDVALFSVPRVERRRLILLSAPQTLAALVTDLAGMEMVQDLYIAVKGDPTVWNPVFRGVRGRKWPLFMQGRLFLLDMESTPNGSLVELCDAADAPRIVVDEGPNTIQKCLPIRSGFLVIYLINRQPYVEQRTATGKLLRILPFPVGGSITFLSSCKVESGSLFFLHESYSEAPSLWECKFPTAEDEPELIRWTNETDRSTAKVSEYWYASADGTRIPIVLLESPTKRPGPQPVVLFGYGGFGATEVPRYSRLAKILVELGVTIARPGIRGGAEFGKQWHEAARGRRRQTAIDDFLAAAEWLLLEGITDPEHLAIMGGSNGGLLVTAAAVQRPDLFKAVVSTGPLTDMVRYERFDGASRWRQEYGTIEDAEDFLALLAYSPLHNVQEAIDYPTMLFVTGDADDRCNPAHARKMVAALQGRRAQQHRILIDHCQNWGHAATLSLTQRVDGLTRKVSFLCEQLDLRSGEGAYR
jgi:prolyl oligopeptidase